MRGRASLRWQRRVTVLLVAGRHRATPWPRGTMHAWLRLVWVKGQYEARPLVESWNSFSRIRVIGDPAKPCRPSGWGLSTTLPPELDRARAAPRHRLVRRHRADGVQRRSGRRRSTSSTTSPTSLTTCGRPRSVIVVGTGGGRDVLSALVFDQQRGHRRRDQRRASSSSSTAGSATSPATSIAIRACASSTTRRAATSRGCATAVDIIQISLIDTWAATASGAFVLTENSLYTRRGLDELPGPPGAARHPDRLAVVLRGPARARSTAVPRSRRRRCMQMGVQRPGDHFAIVRARRPAPTRTRPTASARCWCRASRSPPPISTRSTRSPRG